MSGEKWFGFKAPTNNNLSRPERLKESDAGVSIDEHRLAALRFKVNEIEVFAIPKSVLEEAENAVSNLTLQDLIQVINSFDLATLDDMKVPLYYALLARFDAEETEE